MKLRSAFSPVLPCWKDAHASRSQPFERRQRPHTRNRPSSPPLPSPPRRRCPLRFGCFLGVDNGIVAITFVALGTSLPDTFASMSAAVHDSNADASIGNITGSNSVNVFLGLGLPWTIAVIYYAILDAEKGVLTQDFVVEAGTLGFSVVVFCACSIVAFSILMVRLRSGFRRPPAIARVEAAAHSAPAVYPPRHSSILRSFAYPTALSSRPPRRLHTATPALVHRRRAWREGHPPRQGLPVGLLRCARWSLAALHRSVDLPEQGVDRVPGVALSACLCLLRVCEGMRYGRLSTF